VAENIAFDSVAPVIPVRDLGAALERYRRLGFTVHAYEGGGFGYADRGSVSLHLREGEKHDPSRDGTGIYLFVF
jgi:hypothetical protein